MYLIEMAVHSSTNLKQWEEINIRPTVNMSGARRRDKNTMKVKKVLIILTFLPKD